LVPCTIPIQQLVGVPADAFQPPTCSGGDSFDLATVGLSSARFVRIDASQLQPGAGGTAGFALGPGAAVPLPPLPPAPSPPTATIGPAHTTATTLGTGASTPEPCAPPGLEGVECALTELVPSVVCPGQSIAPRLARTVDRKLGRTRALVGHAARNLAQGKTR